MGRIDQALRLSNVDVGQDAGAIAAEAEASPWFIGHERHDTREGAVPLVSETAPDVPGGRGVLEAIGTRSRRHASDRDSAERLVVAKDAPALLVEKFRSLAAILHGAQLERSLKSVIVTSASPGDGKTNVALNLALTLSESYQRRVLLVDADLRLPSLHRVLGVPNHRGLAEALTAKIDEKVPAIPISDMLTFVPAGEPQGDPLGGLSSERMKRIVQDAAAQFDWVIVDSPPVGVLADGRLVSETVDAALLVVRAGVTRFPDVAAAADTIGRERILGIVLNAVDPTEIRGEDYYRHYYSRPPKRGQPTE